MARQAIVEGKFYEKDFGALDKQITGCFTGEKGPGELPITRDDTKKIKAIIAPHAGYVFSGSAAAWAYKEIAERHFPKTYILLGFSHDGEDSGISIEDWKTPFGLIKTDKALAMHLKENTSLKINETPHISEHSIEVQLPFLQFVSKDQLANLNILPISIDRDIDFRTLGEEMYNALKGKDIVFIVSSDFTHYGRGYGYVPFTTDISARLKEMDEKAIDLIKWLKIDEFGDYLNRTQITICGYYPILLLMKILSMEEDKPKGSLLMYYTSGELTGDYSMSVSYVSMMFR
ncbi:MAG: AmmeMemoRadiSam system protein B [archaeon]